MKLFYKNEYLFSEIYLKEITQIEEDPAVKAILTSLKEYRDYADTSNLSVWNESFVHEILNALKFGVRKIDGNTALLNQFGSDEIITLCYSLLPSEDLNSTLMGQNWSEKIIRNLKETNLKWGILTNGDQWRIYHTEELTPYENYLEIDLKGIMDSEDVNQYQIFDKFMRAENFVINQDGNCQFDLFKKESHERINYIEEELKNALKQKEEGGKGILSNICMGYVDYLRESEDPDFSEESLRDTIYSSAMLYMFRLLFLFYAKARRLLKESNQELFSDVLQAAQKIQEKGKFGKDDHSLWNNLRELFSNIDLTYNGGLFNPTENDFVEEKRLSNRHLASVIYFMTFYEDKAGNQVPISFRDMGVRHLGSLYEGLLEHKLFVAEEDTEVKITKNEIKFIPTSKGGIIVAGKFIPKGKVYFGNDKGMRKASGSYYTPEYIVDYIVQNTVGKKFDELKSAFFKENKDTIDSLKTAIDENEKIALTNFLITSIGSFTFESVLKLSVLDPAMGSGHFLVNATNLISNYLTEFHNSFNIISDTETSSSYWRRRVVENCIYGVDLNSLAVELAKLSLWILSMAKDQPLSFLDHHLKCGNSLIGSQLKEIGQHPHGKGRKTKKTQLSLFENNYDFEFAIDQAITKYQEIQSHESRVLGDIGDKKQLLDDIQERLKPYRGICDFHTGIYFGSNITVSDYEKTLSNFNDQFHCSEELFLHWELEYPEIFMGRDGFDVVFGNPPYVQIKQIPWVDKDFYQTRFKFAVGRFNLFYFFIEQSANLLKKGGLSSFIVPDRILLNTQCDALRSWLFIEKTLIEIASFCEPVFDDAVVDAVIIFFKNERTNFTDIKVKNGVSVSEVKNVEYKLIPHNYFKDSPSNQFNLNYDPTISNIINKIRKKSLELGDIAEIKDGIIQGKVKNELFLKEPIDTHSKKLLFGKDINRYHISFNDNWINYKPDEMMKLERERLAGKGAGLRMRVPEIFERNKILTRQTADEIIASYDDQNYYYSNTLHGTTITDGQFDPLCILALLNSKLMTWYYRNTTAENGKVFAQIKIVLLKKIPILSIRKNEQAQFVELVNKIFSLVQQNSNADISNLCTDIDRLVYQNYELTDDEITIIEKAK